MNTKSLKLIAILLVGVVLSGCTSKPVFNVRYDKLEPLYEQLQSIEELTVSRKLDRELVEQASERDGWHQLSATQAFYINQIGQATITPVMAKNTTLVILHDTSRPMYPVTSFRELFNSTARVGIPNEDTDLVKWIIYTLNESDNKITSNLTYGYKQLAKIHNAERLVVLTHRQETDPLTYWQQAEVDVIICWDYQAQAIQAQTGDQYQIIIPSDTIKTKQYLVYRGDQPSPLPISVKAVFEKYGYSTTNHFDFPEAGRYTNAFSNYKQDFRRVVLSEFKGSYASVSEKAFINMTVLLIFVAVATWVYLRTKFKNRFLKLVTAMVCYLLAWQFLWIIRSLVWDDMNWLQMLMWFSAYPLILSSTISWQVVCYELRYGKIIPAIQQKIQFCFVLFFWVFCLTNTWHQQFFGFSETGTGIYWYRYYNYPWGFIFFYIIVFIYWIMGFVDYITYASVKERRRQLVYMLFLMITIIVINLIIYYFGRVEIIFDVAWQSTYLGLFFLNFAAQNKFIDQGLDFASIFNRLKIPVAIVSHEGKWLYTNQYFAQFKASKEFEDKDYQVEPHSIIETNDLYYKYNKRKLLNKDIIWLNDITSLERKKNILVTEQEILAKTQQLLIKESKNFASVLSSFSQLIINEDSKANFNYLLKDLLQTLVRVKNYGLETYPELKELIKFQVGRANRYLRLMLWGLQDETISGRQMYELLKIECSMASIKNLDITLMMKQKSLFPKELVRNTFCAIVHFLNCCIEADYRDRIMIRVEYTHSAVKINSMLTKMPVDFQLLELYAEQNVIDMTVRSESDAVNVSMMIGRGEGQI